MATDKQIDAWSELYSIDRNVMELCVNPETGLGIFSNHQEYMLRIASVNSRLATEFLKSLPPIVGDESQIGLAMDFPHPSLSYRLCTDMTHPYHDIERKNLVAAMYWDSNGVESSCGERDKQRLFTADYLKTTVAWSSRIPLLEKGVPQILSQNWFLESFAIGFLYDNRRGVVLENPTQVGVGGYQMLYRWDGGIFNPSAGIYEEDEESLQYLFGENWIAVKEAMKQFNSTVFEQDKKETKRLSTREQSEMLFD